MHVGKGRVYTTLRPCLYLPHIDFSFKVLTASHGSLPELSCFPPQKGLSPLKKAKGGNHVQVIFHTGCYLNRNPRLRMPRENVGKGRAYTMFRRLNSLKEAKGGNHAQVIFHTGCDLSPNPGCDLNRNPRLRMPRENVGKAGFMTCPPGLLASSLQRL